MTRFWIDQHNKVDDANLPVSSASEFDPTINNVCVGTSDGMSATRNRLTSLFCITHPIRLLLILVVSVLLINQSTAQDDSSTSIRLKSIFSLTQIDASPIVLRSAVISPDARMIAWNARAGLCLYIMDSQAQTCVDFPSNARIDAVNLYWSPDSQIIAMDEDSFRTLRDGDIWLFNVESRQFLNRTDDGTEAGLLRTDAGPEPLLDLVPTWDQNTGDLYFLRWRPRQNDSLGLYRIRAGGGGFLGLNSTSNQILTDSQPELVMDLTGRVENIHFSIYTFQYFSLKGAMAISPDSSQVAFLIRGTQSDAPTNGIYLADLRNGDFRFLVPTNAISGSELPDWAREMLGDGLAWAGDDLILTMSNAFITEPGLNTVTYHIATENGAFSSLLDYTTLDNRVSFVGRTSAEDGLINTQYGFATPDGEWFLYLHSNPNFAEPGAIFAVPINGGGQPQMLSSAVDTEELTGASVQHVSYGINEEGLHVLMGEHLYTFELSNE